MKHNNEKEKVKRECLRKLRLVLDMELSTKIRAGMQNLKIAKNKIQATGSLAVVVLRYSF